MSFLQIIFCFNSDGEKNKSEYLIFLYVTQMDKGYKYLDIKLKYEAAKSCKYFLQLLKVAISQRNFYIHKLLTIFIPLSRCEYIKL